MATTPQHQRSGDPTVARPPITALDPPLTPYALAGTALWAVVGLVSLAAAAPSAWVWTCLAGALIGVGLTIVGRLRERR
ncbi:DUF2530 domain-containing protein [Natronosporangium hydrolyticum]|uniref:DUF2530 domain-containing protein n=1 Tax=Natronosporangium hydrolyticum TaxID=2811111 RepID=UPI003B845324